ncbi:23S rRNA (uracil(1939)-C(5))-methyltransferase RlmD [Stutzerimonas decontaminans]|uniref:23S rRNA (uracil(1939)-C(5))-methyltransferase RlmD n=2 Tax=Stutzerimonas TaxID=2901164 RepID=A0ABX4W2I5_9GAMM|nr:23S rRNA (uracil(1939)-C(5))-methyltransferase RlmD [Stutzerimonas decontaminans]AHY42369.1 23S rRNA methyltransferase [Stutzerimonas decontaminans]MCQ4246196.1 23S rRNA (uracil(1939)-C(5))-methyltransferase RlmD [Stutzerimonas decontaminans]PNF86658.1 23S rRNA (uracil(1939)-C(5))-methyltransferase RlmD [Stutzerimonas decontaminans]
MAKRSGALRFQPSGGERKPQVPVGKKQRLNIERLANDGRGIAFIEGRTWFVEGALPGEEVEARVLAARSQIVEARCERVLQASAQRQLEPCPHARRCGGCNLQHAPLADQLALKQHTLAEQLARVADLQPEEWAEPLVGPAFGYRRRARLAVRWDVKSKHLDIGFRASASQEIVSISECPVLVQPLQSLLPALLAALRDLSKPQAIGHVELFSGTAEAVLIRHTATLPEMDVARLRSFATANGAQLWWQGEGEPLPDDAATTLGYRLEAWDLELTWRPGDFVQVNAPVNDAMVAQALKWLGVGKDEAVLDLFCGLGNFSLPLARSGAHVVGVEGVEAMVGRAQDNARRNGLERAHFYRADLSKPLADAPWAGSGFAAVLLDPPRDGALEIVRQMSMLKAQRVVYVSCNPATLARDARELASQGFRLKRAGVLDMFPQTAHVEAMALFERS